MVASCCAASLLIPATLTNLDLGSSPNASGSGTHLTANGMAFRPIGPGELAAVNGLCAAIGPDASVVILDSLTADRFAQVAHGTCDTPTAILNHPTAKTVGAVLSGIERACCCPVLMARDQSLLAPYGGGPRQVVNLLTTQEARDPTAPPTGTWPIQYALAVRPGRARIALIGPGNTPTTAARPGTPPNWRTAWPPRATTSSSSPGAPRLCLTPCRRRPVPAHLPSAGLVPPGRLDRRRPPPAIR